MNKCVIRYLINCVDPVILEIGCAEGLDTQKFIDAFDDLNFKLYCFEPAHRNVIEFQKRIKDNRVQLFECAIGNVDGEVDFYEGAENKTTGETFPYSDSLRKPAPALFEIWPMFGDESTFEKKKVESVRLDTFYKYAGLERADFWWLDCQGSEDLVIEGAQEALKKTRFIYTEYSNREIYSGEKNLKEILDMLPDFKMVVDFGTDVLLKNMRIE